MMAAAPQQTADSATQLDGLRLPEGGAWITAAREDALARLRATGLPQRRDEYWKFTRPDSLTQAEVPRAVLFDGGDEAEIFGDMDCLRLVFVDGVFDAGASDDPEMAGLRIERLSDVAAQDLHWARDLYGTLEARGQTPVPRPLAALLVYLESIQEG